MNKYQLAQWGENKAVEFLEAQGYKIIKRNFHSPYGEIDIIATDNQYLLCVEVKTRISHLFGTALAAVTPQKQNRIIRTAYYFLSLHSITLPVRFDIVAIECKKGIQKYSIQYIKNAFLGNVIGDPAH